MRPRSFWLTLALGAPAIGGVTLLRTVDPAMLDRFLELVRDRMAWLEAAASDVSWQSVYWVPVTAIVLATVLVGWRIRVVRRRMDPTVAMDDSPAFEAVLDAAVTAGSDPRRRQATLMAERGQTIGAIARETRLARDAVRTVIRPA